MPFVLPLQYLASLIGGGRIGVSAALLLLINGRIAGISGILGSVLHKPDARLFMDTAFVAGLLLGPVLFLVLFGAWPAVRIEASWPMLILAGFLVGFGDADGIGLHLRSWCLRARPPLAALHRSRHDLPFHGDAYRLFDADWRLA